MATHDQGIVKGAVTDYQRVGGGPAIAAVVDRFCQLLLADQHLRGLLRDVDIALLKRHQVLLISRVLGGPADDAEPGLEHSRTELRISRDGLGQVVSYLVLSLQEAGVDPEIIARMGPTLAAAEQDVVTVR